MHLCAVHYDYHIIAIIIIIIIHGTEYFYATLKRSADVRKNNNDLS